jgi:hypothetical protein
MGLTTPSCHLRVKRPNDGGELPAAPAEACALAVTVGAAGPPKRRFGRRRRPAAQPILSAGQGYPGWYGRAGREEEGPAAGRQATGIRGAPQTAARAGQDQQRQPARNRVASRSSRGTILLQVARDIWILMVLLLRRWLPRRCRAAQLLAASFCLSALVGAPAHPIAAHLPRTTGRGWSPGAAGAISLPRTIAGSASPRRFTGARAPKPRKVGRGCRGPIPPTRSAAAGATSTCARSTTSTSASSPGRGRSWKRPAFRQAVVNGILRAAHLDIPEGGAPISITPKDGRHRGRGGILLAGGRAASDNGRHTGGPPQEQVLQGNRGRPSWHRHPGSGGAP